MVLEHLLPEDWLEKKSRYAFVLGFLYSFIGIVFAKFLFPSDPALVAVAFTSLMLLPELYKLFSIEEREEGKEKQFSVKELFRDNLPFVKIYVLLFLGILLAYSLAAMMLPSFEVNNLFREQVEFRHDANIAGNAATVYEEFDFSSVFKGLLGNNAWVLTAIFAISLLTGDGAIFLITWNASLWGTVFGVTARNAGFFGGENTYLLFGIMMLIVLPHVLLESLAYILAAISGAVISKDVLLEKFDSDRFHTVFTYNFMLFLAAVLVLILGVVVETYILGYSNTYFDIIMLSYGG